VYQAWFGIRLALEEVVDRSREATSLLHLGEGQDGVEIRTVGGENRTMAHLVSPAFPTPEAMIGASRIYCILEGKATRCEKRCMERRQQLPL